MHARLPFTESHFRDPPVSQLLSDDSERVKVVSWTLFEVESQTSTRSEQLKSIEPSPSLYFFYQVDLSLIANSITNRLYGTIILQAGRKQIEMRSNHALRCFIRGYSPSATNFNLPMAMVRYFALSHLKSKLALLCTIIVLAYC